MRLGGFRSGTITAYSRMFRDFLGFVVAAGLALVQVNTLTLLAFLVYLYLHQFKHSAMVNYVTAIRTMLLVYGQSRQYFRDKRISLFLKAIKINRPFQPKVAPSFDEHLLTWLILALCSFCLQVIVFVDLLFMFRLSNMLPHSIGSFDITRQLCRADVVFGENKAVLLVKWSQTIQDRTTTKTITIPHLGNSILCPVTAIKKLLCLTPGGPNDPLCVNMGPGCP